MVVDVDAAAAGLRSTGVYVDPALNNVVDASAVQALVDAVKGQQPPVFVLGVPLDADGGQSPQDVATAVHAALGTDGVYFVSQRAGDSWDLAAVKFGVVTNGRDVKATFVAYDKHPDDLAAQFSTAVSEFTKTASTTATSAAAAPASHGSSGIGVLPWLAVLLVLALVASVVVWWLRRSRRGRAAPAHSASAGAHSASAGAHAATTPSRSTSTPTSTPTESISPKSDGRHRR